MNIIRLKRYQIEKLNYRKLIVTLIFVSNFDLKSLQSNFCSLKIDNIEDVDLIYVSIGELVNLTCFIHTKEIDWHFKDYNSTTTNIISNGLQLQILKQISSTHSSFKEKNHKNNLKYKVSSDHNSNHMLSIYIEDKSDEGSYQCVDSKSDTPIKKTIKLFLSKFFF